LTSTEFLRPIFTEMLERGFFRFQLTELIGANLVSREGVIWSTPEHVLLS
jgi:hypothetical protein